MNFSESIRLALENLKSNRLRSFLTMLGIIIGISAVITITTIGNSLQKTIAATMRELGGTNLIECYVQAIYPEFETEEEWEAWEYPEMDPEEKLSYEKLSEFQEAFADRIDQVVVTEDVGNGTADAGEEDRVNVSVVGVTPGYLEGSKINLITGRDISDQDNRQKKATAVVSDLFAKYACGGENPLGKQISVESDDGTVMKYYVVGVYEYDPVKMGTMGDKISEREIATQIMIPYTCAVEQNPYSNDGEGLQYFSVSAKDGEDASLLAIDISYYFNETLYGANGNFEMYCYDLASEISQIDTVLQVLTIAISVIAAISLIVGGVGVMNIMLVSVVERTKEIGIRKAMGARNKSIRRQFLTEAVVICLFGGIIGILIGIFNGFVLSQVAAALVVQYQEELGTMLTVTVSPSLTAIVVSVVFSMLIGIIFGYYPAKRAANMSPIDALRYE